MKKAVITLLHFCVKIVVRETFQVNYVLCLFDLDYG